MLLDDSEKKEGGINDFSLALSCSLLFFRSQVQRSGYMEGRKEEAAARVVRILNKIKTRVINTIPQMFSIKQARRRRLPHHKKHHRDQSKDDLTIPSYNPSVRPRHPRQEALLFLPLLSRHSQKKGGKRSEKERDMAVPSSRTDI
jgi:hypothetical protein